MAKDIFRNIGLIGRMTNEATIKTVQQLIVFLEQQSRTIIIEEDTARALVADEYQKCNRLSLGESCDLVIVVGGDGCLLGAARDLAKSSVPVLGINRGRLGFLTDISPAEMEQKILEVLQGEYTQEYRFLLSVEIKRDGVVISEGSALNDVVLNTGDAIHMMEFGLEIEGQFVYNQRSDGLIVSTPTGSTAYALSGGGPIMHPNLDAVVLVPMHPHTLSSRPIVVAGGSEIKLTIQPQEIKPVLSCDGQSSVKTETGDVVYIRKNPYKLNLIHPCGHDFYEACRSKLGWSSEL